MKFIILFLITFPVFACQIQVPTSEAQRYLDALPNGVPPLFKCEDKPEEKCHCADSIIWEQADFEDDIVLDYIKKVDAVSCEKLIAPEVIEPVEGEEPIEALPFNEYQDCDDKFTELVCDNESQKVKNFDQLSVYCAVPVMKVDGKKLVNSEVKKAALDSARAIKKQLEDELKMVQKARDCGSRAINFMSVRNAKKGLNKQQKKEIIVAYSEIKNMLDVGSLDNAKDAINEALVDGVLITNQDKSSMIEVIVECQ